LNRHVNRAQNHAPAPRDTDLNRLDDQSQRPEPSYAAETLASPANAQHDRNLAAAYLLNPRPSHTADVAVADVPVADLPGVDVPAYREEPPEHVGHRKLLGRIPWPLLVILALQAWLSTRLLHANTAFTDEALYLWAGHVEWSHLLHGTPPLPPFPTFFSGAPVMYPPIGGLAYSLGGLTAARAVSLAFMLVTTTLLWDSAKQLFGRLAAFFAAALFASLGPVMRLGAFATYDAMALMLLATSAWCVARSAAHRDRAGWLFAAALALALANATKYATLLFDPVIILAAGLTAIPKTGRKQATFRAAWVGAVAGAILLAAGELATHGNAYYLTGFRQTTLTRAASTDSVSFVLHSAWTWTWPVVAPAFAAVLFAATAAVAHRPRGPRLGLVCLLAGAVLLVPLEQARIHTATSLDKHMAFGSWFAAIAAGWAISAIIGWLPTRQIRIAAVFVALLALSVPLSGGIAQSKSLTNWANSSRLIAALRPVMAGHHGRALIDARSIAEFYLNQSGSQWKRWSSTASFLRPDGTGIGTTVATLGDRKLFTRNVHSHYFQVIELNGIDPIEQAIQDAAQRTAGYVLVASGAYGPETYRIWVDRRYAK
jgi:4-amino-4-deoxy-L-arabinose transferase-like glycosyltransferase